MATKESATDKDLIHYWVEKSLEDRNFDNFEIHLSGSSKNGDGYVGDIVFVSVSGESKGKRENLHLVVKHGKKSNYLRKNMPFRLCFEKEIYFYDVVLKAFKELEIQTGVKNGFDSVPVCYKTFLFDNMEVLVLDNLTKKGYQLHDRKKPLNMKHVKSVLTEYGKFHALTFALRDQRPDKYKKVVSNYSASPIRNIMLSSGMSRLVDKNCIAACEILKETNNMNLFQNFKDSIKTGAANTLIELFDAKEPQSAFTHGDCWNNNFMFQYQEEDNSSPIKVKILDWQMSGLHSPIFDVTNFLFISCSTKELQHFEELIGAYYSSFSNFLSSLGSTPEKCFTYGDLKKHLKRYSLLGVIVAVTFLKIVLCDENEAPDLGEVMEGKTFGEAFDIEIKDKELFKERLVALMKCYYQIKN